MAYFADLSPYRYGHPPDEDEDDDGWDQDRMVGWLARGQDVPQGATPDGLVDALLICATRPARLYRGRHECDLCDVTPRTWVDPSGARMRDPHPASHMDLDGREVFLGNGEIRVQGSDGLWYAAPTLVAHYVAAHHYAPPAPFIDGVRARARTIYVARGAQLARLRALDFHGQLDVALSVVRAGAAHERVDVEPHVPALLSIVRGNAPPTPLREPALDDTLTAAGWWTVAFWFAPQHRDPMRGLIALLERAADSGIDVARF
jgi:hypothetical protein